MRESLGAIRWAARSTFVVALVGALFACRRQTPTYTDAAITEPVGAASASASASPTVAASASADAGVLEVLSREQDHPKFVATADDDVVFTVYEGGLVQRVNKAGGAPTTLLSGIEDAYGIAARGDVLFVAARASRANGGGIWKIPKAGKPSLFAAEDFPSAIAIAEDRVVWATRDAIVAAPLHGKGQSRAIALHQAGPHGLVARDGRVVWSSYHDGTVSFANSKSEVTVVARGLANPAGVAVTGREILVACTGDGTIRAVPFAAADSGANPRTLTTQPLPFVAEIATDDTFVYFTTAAGLVGRVPVAGGDATILARDQGNPVGIAIDRTSVYWADDRAGTVMKRTPR